MNLPVAEIYVGRRARVDVGLKETQDLAADIKENGLILPIAVRPPNDDDRAESDYAGEPWVLIAGGRRLTAFKMLGLAEIPAHQREPMDSYKHRLLELNENLKRKAMTIPEELAARKEIAELYSSLYGMTQGEIAKMQGMDGGNLSKDLKAANYIEKYPELAKASSKTAIVQAGKLLDQQARKSAEVRTRSTAIAPLEDRVVTRDALDFAESLPRASVDLMLIDGPYGIDQSYLVNTEGKQYLGEDFDDSLASAETLYRKLFPLLVRATRETGWLVFFCSLEVFDLLRDCAENCCSVHAAYRHPTMRGSCLAADDRPCTWLRPEPIPWIWYRPNSQNNPRNRFLHAKAVTELLLVVNMGKATLAEETKNLLIFDAEYGSDRVHINQKPLDLYKDLIRKLTFTGDTVCDTFFGSGNSLAAAASMSRVVTGCDSNAGLLRQALGRIASVEAPITKDLIQASLDRYQRNIQRSPGTAPIRDPAPRQGDWSYEILPLPGEFLGYIKYADHNMAQLRHPNEDELDTQLNSAIVALRFAEEEDKLDPSCCKPEECQDFVNDYIKGVYAQVLTE